MPSEERIIQALEVLAPTREAFLSAVALSAEEVRGILEREAEGQENPLEKLARELGPLGSAHIDVERLAPFAVKKGSLDGGKWQRVRKAYETLRDLKNEGDSLFTARCPLDGYLRGTILEALGKAGRAFGAARVVEAVLTGIPEPEGIEDATVFFPQSRWNRAEKAHAPPLVVEVEGQDLKVASLGEILEGTLKIVLVVNGPAAPAPLVRLITPGVAVAQTDDPADLAIWASVPGPGVAALMPPGAAKFLHLPGGATLSHRLQVKLLPDKEPRRALGAISAFQQTEELRQLRALTTPVETLVSPNGGRKEEEPLLDEAGQLAAWLIQQARL